MRAEYFECNYCGTTNDSNHERCKKCNKYKDENPEEFDKYINSQNNEK